MIKSPQLSNDYFKTNDLKPERKLKAKGFEYALQEFPIWANKTIVAKELFSSKGFPKRINICYFDIPNCTDTSKASDKFFDALADSENLDIFNTTIVNIIVNKAWRELRYFFFWTQMLPQILLLLSYLFWQNNVIVDID